MEKPKDTQPRRVQLLLSKITEDPDVQPREKIDPQKVQEYAERMQAGDTFPPLDVFDEGNILASGYHRIAAYRQIGAKMVEVGMHEGDKREAILFAAGSNATHGLPRSNADKRRAVTLLLEDAEWRQQSDSWIARTAKFSIPLVATVRANLEKLRSGQSNDREIEKEEDTRTFKTRHGTTARMNISNLGRKPSKQPAADEEDDDDGPPPEELEARKRQAQRQAEKTGPEPLDEDEDEEIEPGAPEWAEAQQQIRDFAGDLAKVVAKLEKLKRTCEESDTKRVLPGIPEAIDGIFDCVNTLDALFPKPKEKAADQSADEEEPPEPEEEEDTFRYTRPKAHKVKSSARKQYDD